MEYADQPDAFDPLAVDLALFGCWEAAPAYREALPDGDVLAEDVRAVVLETKSAEGVQVSAAEDLRRLLKLIGEKAQAEAERRYKEWVRDGPPPAVIQRISPGRSAEPEDLAAQAGDA